MNPSADLIRNFRHYPDDKHVPRQENALLIEQYDPEFVQSLLTIADSIDSLNVMDRIVHGNMPSETELSQHEALVTQKLMLVENFVTQKFGSVQEFMKWFV